MWPFKKKEEPRVRTITETYWLVDTQHANEFFKAYEEDLVENDDYDLSAKELKEDYEGEKVYRFEPLELPVRMENRDVYSCLEDKWMKIGRVKKTADLNGKITLYLYPNIYKKVWKDEIEKVSDDSYFGIDVTKIVSSAD